MEKFICVGKNYLEHAKELGDPVPENPVLFLKPPSSGYSIGNHETGSISLPRDRGIVHYECEIILKLNSHSKIEAVSLGLDMTLRDLQTEMKTKGLPWEISKVFKHAAVVGDWIPLKDFTGYLDETFTFSLDGVIRQKAKGREMRTLPEACLAYASRMFPLVAGDIVFTGTPAGVGAVKPGQKGELTWGDYLQYSVQFE